MRRLALWVVVIGVCAAGPAEAAGKIKKGVSKKAALTLQRLADADAAKADAKRKGQVEAFRDAVRRDLGKELAAVEAALKKERGYASLKQKVDEMLAKAKGKPLSQRDQKALTDLFQKQKGLFAAAWKSARVDERRVKSVIQKHARRLGRVTFKWMDLVTVIIVISPPASGEGGTPGTPSTAAASCFDRPYENEGEHKTGVLLAYIDAQATRSTGRVLVQAASIWGGGGVSRATVGSFFTVPAGYSHLKVTAKLRLHHTFESHSIGGIGLCGGDAITQLVGLNNQAETKFFSLGMVASPLLFLAWTDGQDDYILTHTYTIPTTGGEYLVRAGANQWIATIVNAFSITKVEGEVKEICVEALP